MQYTTPELTVILFTTQDVLTISEDASPRGRSAWETREKSDFEIG